MTSPYTLDDNSVLVVIGTGAGGGTLANELAQKGIDVVALEAGGRHLPDDYINDEWASFSQLAWTDMRTTSGSWRVAQDFANLPAWIVKAVGGSTTHWAGASLRIQDHEFRAKTTYGDIEGTSLLDWPLTLQELEPYYDKAEDKLGVTRTHGIPGLPGNNNFKIMKAGADPEVLEFRFPVLLEDFHINRGVDGGGSGGKGKWQGGNGTIRTLRFLETMDCAILSSHRKVAPAGLAGGKAGSTGSTRVRRNDGTVEELDGCAQTTLSAGEAVIVQTPTPGGYGEPDS